MWENVWEYSDLRRMGESPWMGVPIHSSQIATILVSICQRHEDGRENSKLISRSADVKAEQKKAPKTSQEGGAQKCVERCCEMARKTSDQFHKFSIPCFDDHQKEPDDLGNVGEVSESCSQIGLEFLYLARIGRPDPLWPVNYLARSVTKWNQACDLRLARLISYIHQTFDHKHYCHVGNQTIHCKLGLFQDADFGGQLTDSTSRSGGVLCRFESHTFVPNPSACKNQTPRIPQQHWSWNYIAWCKITDGGYSSNEFVGHNHGHGTFPKLEATPSLCIEIKSQNIMNHLKTSMMYFRTRDHSAWTLHYTSSTSLWWNR